MIAHHGPKRNLFSVGHGLFDDLAVNHKARQVPPVSPPPPNPPGHLACAGFVISGAPNEQPVSEPWILDGQPDCCHQPHSQPLRPPGSPGTVGERGKRKLRSFVIPHIPHDDVVLPEEVQGRRAFGSETEMEVISGVLARHLETMRNKHAITLEHLRMGALKGEILDADGSVISNLFTELQEEATEVYERAYHLALANLPKGFNGQITWSEIDNRSFLRLAHGSLLGLMHRREGAAAMALAKQMLAWCPMDNIGVRFLLGDIALLRGDHKAAMKEYLKGAPNSAAHWYQAALIVFREADYVSACTYLRRGIAANPYIAEGLTGRTVLAEHLYWHASNVLGPEWAIDYLERAAGHWTPEEVDFVDWVFNASAVLRERAEMMTLREGLTYERAPDKRDTFAAKSMTFIDRITDTLSKKMVRKVRNRDGAEDWPWARGSCQ